MALIIGSVLTGVSVSFLVQAVTSTSSSIVNMARYVTNTDQPGFEIVQKRLNEIDLEYHVGIIQQFVEEIGKCETMEKSIKSAIMGVQEILDRIERNLQIIKDSIQIHEKKWFKRWRFFRSKSNIKGIIKDKELLERRYQMLIDLVQIYSKYSS